RWDDLVATRPAVPDERNSVTRVHAALQLLPPSMKGGGPILNQNDSSREYSNTPPQQQLSPGAVDALRERLDATAPALAEAHLLGALTAAGIRTGAVRGVERVLAKGEPSPAALEAARRLLEQEARQSLMLGAFRVEGALVDDTIRALADGRLSREDVAKSGLFF